MIFLRFVDLIYKLVWQDDQHQNATLVFDELTKWKCGCDKQYFSSQQRK